MLVDLVPLSMVFCESGLMILIDTGRAVVMMMMMSA
jgi:hypothetical protein